MSTKWKAIWRGVAQGLVAGLIFGGARVLSATALGLSPFAPFRTAASVWIGSDALTTTPAWLACIVGTLVHFVLAGLFGAIYVGLNNHTEPAARSSLERHAAVGLAYGAAIWLLDYRLVAANFLPWLVDASQWRELVLHALFFGLPLGVTYAASARTTRPVAGSPKPTR